MSDRIGRRPVLLLNTAGAAVLYALAAWPVLSPAPATAVIRDNWGEITFR